MAKKINLMKNKYSITKCICFDKTFQEIKKIMKEKNISSICEIIEVTGVAANCKLCLPYITFMIETGQTEFEIMLDQN